MLPTERICVFEIQNTISYAGTSMRKETMEKYNTSEIPKSSRITRLVDHLYAKMPRSNLTERS